MDKLELPKRKGSHFPFPPWTLDIPLLDIGYLPLFPKSRSSNRTLQETEETEAWGKASVRGQLVAESLVAVALEAMEPGAPIAIALQGTVRAGFEHNSVAFIIIGPAAGGEGRIGKGCGQSGQYQGGHHQFLFHRSLLKASWGLVERAPLGGLC